jgi:hypothetical protein
MSTENANPYKASDIDEKPAEIVRFLKAEPVPQKIVGLVLWDAMHYAYTDNKKSYLALGFMQGFYLALVAVVVIAFREHPQMTQPWLVGIVVVALFALWVLLYIMSLNAIFRLLRKEKMTVMPSIREIRHLLYSLVNGMLFLLTFVSAFVLALVVILPGVYLTDNVLSNVGTNYPKLVLGISLYILGTGFWIAFACVFYMRSALGLHCIVDQHVNFLTAYRRAWSLTRGNLRTLAFGTPGTSKPLITGLILLVTCGLGFFPIIGYYFCWLTVAYLMLSGQCETVAQQPDEW